MTLEEIAAGAHRGERIAFDGVPEEDHIQTLMGCGDSNPCCNHVGGGYLLELSDRLLIEMTGPFKCSGNECDWHCEPFGKTPTKRVRFVGRVEVEPTPGMKWAALSEVVVEKYCVLE